MRYKVFEPILILGRDKFDGLDIRIKVRGGGRVSQLYAIRQAMGKSVIAYYQKCKFFLRKPSRGTKERETLQASFFFFHFFNNFIFKEQLMAVAGSKGKESLFLCMIK